MDLFVVTAHWYVCQFPHLNKFTLGIASWTSVVPYQQHHRAHGTREHSTPLPASKADTSLPGSVGTQRKEAGSNLPGAPLVRLASPFPEQGETPPAGRNVDRHVRCGIYTPTVLPSRTLYVVSLW